MYDIIFQYPPLGCRHRINREWCGGTIQLIAQEYELEANSGEEKVILTDLGITEQKL